MGEAQKRLEKAGELVGFAARAIGMRIGRGDRANLSADGGSAELRAFGLVARALVTAAYPQGMERRDGRVWAAWQDFLDEDVPDGRVTRIQIEWLAKHAGSDTLKVPAPLAPWRESVADYLHALADAPALE